MKFKEEYVRLNKAQKTAVDLIDGPLLVVAGPGTGKTQLLSARVAKILQDTDTLPQSILCLTFTESAALNMRERLSSFIGKEAYDVNISTYHTFGSEIIRNYPEFFQDSRLEKAVDDLGKREILGKIIEGLPYDNTLKNTSYSLGDLMGTISELKRSLHTPEKLRNLSAKNQAQISELSKKFTSLTKGIKTFPSSINTAKPLYSELAEAIKPLASENGSLADYSYAELLDALDEAEASQKSTPLTKWKNSWLYKNAKNDFVFTNIRLSIKLSDLAHVLEEYSKQLEKRGLFDFDDMILRSIKAIESNDELRLNLQEKYLYVLLDEFQDTNAAQFKLVKLLNDNPVHEGRPNIMAVGDDDQGIYAFQGAKSSNMIEFTQTYKDVPIINLTENYRSHRDILHVAHNIASQIESRLHSQLTGVNKTLEAVADNLPEKIRIKRHEFVGPSEENSWIAHEIQQLINDGTKPSDIAILAPKHKYLEAQVPFLNVLKIPVVYEKKENILNTPIIIHLSSMVRLVDAIDKNQTALINELFPQVLSLPCFKIPLQDIWKTNWAHADRDDKRSWAEIASENEQLTNHVWFFFGLAGQLSSRTLEDVLDILIGSESLEIPGIDQKITSPFKDYYFAKNIKEQKPLQYYETLSHLSVIRQKLRDFQDANQEQLKISDFLNFIDLYEAADQPLINTHPIAQAEEAVQLMTVYKAKGLEFKHVFILSVQDNVWGMSARDKGNAVKLPANISHIRHAGSTEDERLRLFFVALTRAKQDLVLTSHLASTSGKETARLKFMDERDESDKVISSIMPIGSSEVLKTSQSSLVAKQDSIEIGWHAPHVELQPPLDTLLKSKLKKYQMSPTHLNSFIDLEYSGPEEFLLSTILRFPHAPMIDGEFGNAIHSTLEWYQLKIGDGNKPSVNEVIDQFKFLMSRQYVHKTQLTILKKRGETALRSFMKHRGSIFKAVDKSERNFRGEGVFEGDAHLTGKIDHLEINKKSKEVSIIDFKTGHPSKKWGASTNLLKYKQQLYFYMLLIEGSHTYKGYRVRECRLEFIEPDDEGNAVDPLILDFKEPEYNELKTLIRVVWKKIQSIDFPSTDEYSKTHSGSKQFIANLINDDIL